MTKTELFQSDTFQALTSVAGIIVHTSCEPSRGMSQSMNEEVEMLEVVYMYPVIKANVMIRFMFHLGFKVSDFSQDPLIIKFSPYAHNEYKASEESQIEE